MDVTDAVKELMMPAYNYKCIECWMVEVFTHSMFENLEPTCTECGGEMRRSYTAPATVFKGDGFYSTDK